MNPPVRRTPARYMLFLQDVLQQSGVQMSDVAQASGIQEEVFYSLTAAVTDTELERYVAAVRNLTGRVDLGFELGRRVKLNAHGPLGYGLISSPTVHDFVAMMARNFHMLNETWTVDYRRNYAGGEMLYLPRTAPNRDTLHFVMEVFAASFHAKTSLMLGGRMPAYDIHMSIPKPEHAYNYTEMEPVRFHFHESTLPSMRIVLPPSLLNIPMALGNPDVVREIEARCGASSMSPRSEVCWSDYVTMLLREAPSAQITLEALGRHIQVSGRSIDRYLKKEGLSYRELADKVRFERARQILDTGGATVMDVAESMGFSDAANFSRAFKRVVGVSPGEYRQGNAP